MPNAPKTRARQLRSEFQSVVDLMRRLRAPGGCPWDAEQTHASIKRSVIEEAYEVLEAIEAGSDEDLCEELGDLLLQVIFHSEMASERSAFDISDVLRGLNAKLVRRHPHVFADAAVTGTKDAIASWNRIKAVEKREKEAVRGYAVSAVARGLPALVRAQRVGEETAVIGFDWDDASGVRDKLAEELRELDEARNTSVHEDIAAELGDLLFTAVSLARHLKINAEMALHDALDRFHTRFSDMERELGQRGTTVRSATNAQLDAAWAMAKLRTT